MAKSDVEKLTEEKVAKGGVLVKFYFDVQNSDKEKLQPLLVNLINEQLMKERGVVYAYGAIEEPIERENVFMTSAMVTVLFEGFAPLLTVSFRYAPAGIEILQPRKEMHFRPSELQTMLMDISQMSVAYSQFILEKVLKPEEKDQIKRQMESRAETSKKFLEEQQKKIDEEKKK